MKRLSKYRYNMNVIIVTILFAICLGQVKMNVLSVVVK